MHTSLALSATLVVALASNVPLGFWRVGQRRFSWRWLVATHLSIPLVIAVRVGLHVPLAYVPLIAATAIVGQLLGGMVRRRCRSQASLGEISS